MAQPTSNPASASPAASHARLEAQAFETSALTGAQRSAHTAILALVSDLCEAGAPDRPARHPAAQPPLSLAAAVDEDRRNNAILIDGPRGTGKTSLLLSLIEAWRAPWPPRTTPQSASRRADSGPLVPFPLPILDLSLLEEHVTIDLLIAARLQALVTHLGENQQHREPNRGPRRDDRCADEDTTLEDLWDSFVELVANQEGGKKDGLTPESLRRLAVEGVDRSARFDHLIEEVGTHFRSVFCRDPLFVVIIDDADVRLGRLCALMRTLRALHHPRVAFVVAGDLDALHYAQLHELRAEMKESKDEDPYFLPRLTSQILERVFPLSHRFGVRHLPPADRFALEALGLRDLLRLPDRFLKGFLNTGMVGNIDDLLERHYNPALPDRMRNLVDLALALRRAREEAGDDFGPARMLQVLWQASLDHRESKLTARERLRRVLDLHWGPAKERLELRPDLFKVDWAWVELRRFYIDDRNSPHARTVIVKVPHDFSMSLVGFDGKAHPLSYSLACLALLTFEIGVEMGWIAQATLHHLWPQQAWITCEARLTRGGPVTSSAWPKPECVNYSHQILGIIQVLEAALRRSASGDSGLPEPKVEELGSLWQGLNGLGAASVSALSRKVGSDARRMDEILSVFSNLPDAFKVGPDAQKADLVFLPHLGLPVFSQDDASPGQLVMEVLTAKLVGMNFVGKVEAEALVLAQAWNLPFPEHLFGGEIDRVKTLFALAFLPASDDEPNSGFETLGDYVQGIYGPRSNFRGGLIEELGGLDTGALFTQTREEDRPTTVGLLRALSRHIPAAAFRRQPTFQVNFVTMGEGAAYAEFARADVNEANGTSHLLSLVALLHADLFWDGILVSPLPGVPIAQVLDFTATEGAVHDGPPTKGICMWPAPAGSERAFWPAPAVQCPLDWELLADLWTDIRSRELAPSAAACAWVVGVWARLDRTSAQVYDRDVPVLSSSDWEEVIDRVFLVDESPGELWVLDGHLRQGGRREAWKAFCDLILREGANPFSLNEADLAELDAARRAFHEKYPETKQTP